MIKYRTYFDKNNTIIRNAGTNTGRNPVSELMFGGSLLTGSTVYSRFLFHFDETKIKSLYTDGAIPDLTKTTHKVKIYNTSSLNRDYNEDGVGKKRAVGFQLICFKVPEYWVEGVGYDFTLVEYVESQINDTFDVSPSNWYQSSSTFWAQQGVYTDVSTWTGGTNLLIGTQTYEKGNENIEFDLTHHVNNIITGTSVNNYGFGIAFEASYEKAVSNEINYLGMFTRHTQSYFEPFLETTYQPLDGSSATIQDDRNQFYSDKNNKLYLYVNTKGKPTNLSYSDGTLIKPGCEISDASGAYYAGFTSASTKHVTTGVYSLDLNIPSASASTGDFFTDKWTGLTINGNAIADVSLEFDIKASTDFYNVGDADLLPKKFGLSMSGIKREEKIVRGDKRKIIVSARVPYTVDESEVVDGLQYRLYVKQGPEHVTVIDWTDIDRASNHNYFVLDTSWLLPSEYFIDIKVISNHETTTHKEQMKFTIVNNVDLFS